MSSTNLKSNRDASDSGGSRIFQRGALTREGAPTYYLTNFSRKPHENEEILAKNGGGARVPGAPPPPPPADPPMPELGLKMVPAYYQSRNQKNPFSTLPTPLYVALITDFHAIHSCSGQHYMVPPVKLAGTIIKSM